MTPEEHLALAEPNPEFLAFIQNNAPPPPPPADIKFFRKMGTERLAKTLENLPATPAELNEKEITIPTRDASSINAWIVSPNPVHVTGSPVLLWFHGGGFCIGDAREELADARRWSSELGLIVISVNYRLAPEYKFPTAVYDGEDVLKWTIENTTSINADLSKGLLIGGVSAGANIAAALTLLARDQKLSPPITGQILMAPPLLPKSEVEAKYKDRYLSQEQNNKDGFLTPEVIQMFEDSYAADHKSPLYAAFNHPKGHKDLPPTYIQVCGLDPLRDEDLLYEEKLRLESGVKTRLEVYKGLPHHFWGFFPMLSVTRKHGDDTVEGFKWLLDLKKS